MSKTRWIRQINEQGQQFRDTYLHPECKAVPMPNLSLPSIDDEFEEASKNIVRSPWLEAVTTRITNEYNNPVGEIPMRPSKKVVVKLNNGMITTRRQCAAFGEAINKSLLQAVVKDE